MDILAFIAEIVKASAWPLAAVTLALIFRRQVQDLLTRVKKGKVGPAEFEFEQAVRALQAEAPAMLPTESKAPVGSTEVLRAETEPRSAVLEGWLGVESALTALAQSKGMQVAQQDLILVAGTLEANGVLKPRFVSLYRDLRHLRNQAAHEINFTPSVESVLNYVALARRLEASIRRLVEP